MGTPLLPAPALLLGPAAAGEAASGHVQPPRRYACIYKMHTNKMHVDRYSYMQAPCIHPYFPIYQVLTGHYRLWCPPTTWGSHPAASSTPTLLPGCPPLPASPSTGGQNEAQEGWRGPHSTRIARQDLFFFFFLAEVCLAPPCLAGRGDGRAVAWWHREREASVACCPFQPLPFPSQLASTRSAFGHLGCGTEVC